MSYATNETLDAPDAELQAIQMKMLRGVPLSKNEQVRLIRRKQIESDTVASGGNVAAVPGASMPPSAYDIGRAETQQAQDYMRGRSDVLAGQSPSNPPASQPANPYTPRPGASSMERARADGMAIGNDGVPFDPHGAGPRYQPKDIAGVRSQLAANRTPAAPMSNPGAITRRPQPTSAEQAAGMSVSYDQQLGLPEGHGYAQGPDGSFIAFTPNRTRENPSGSVLNPDGTRRRFKSIGEVQQHFALNTAPSLDSGIPAGHQAPTLAIDPAPPVVSPVSAPQPPAAAAPVAPTMQAAPMPTLANPVPRKAPGSFTQGFVNGFFPAGAPMPGDQLAQPPARPRSQPAGNTLPTAEEVAAAPGNPNLRAMPLLDLPTINYTPQALDYSQKSSRDTAAAVAARFNPFGPGSSMPNRLGRNSMPGVPDTRTDEPFNTIRNVFSSARKNAAWKLPATNSEQFIPAGPEFDARRAKQMTKSRPNVRPE